MKSYVLAIPMVLVACGGASAEGPLTVTIGVDRPSMVRQLRGHAYCDNPEAIDPGAMTEMFERCDAPGVEYGQSWVVAYYEADGRVSKLERWEKFAETERGLERFNQLVEKRTQASGPPSVEAKALIGAQQDLPAGTRTWVAFENGEFGLAAVYHLDPRPPEYANVLELVIERR